MNRYSISFLLLIFTHLSPAHEIDWKVYFPTTKGMSWEYQTSSHHVVVQKVIDADERDGKHYGRFEVKNNQTGAIFVEDVYADDKGVFRERMNKEKISEALPFLRFPLKLGNTWQAEAQYVGIKIKAGFRVAAWEQVILPLGKKFAIRVDEDFHMMNDTYTASKWYSPGLGLVKATFGSPGQAPIVIELKKFSAGN